MSFMSSVEISLLEYILAYHRSSLTKRSSVVALLVHAGLIARGARLTKTEQVNENEPQTSVLENSLLSSDPIRLSYLLHRPVPGSSSQSSGKADDQQLLVSITESDGHIFVSLTDNVTEKFGHAEISGMDHVDMEILKDSSLPHKVFSQLSDLSTTLDNELWKPVIRPPASPPSRVTNEFARVIPESVIPPADNPLRVPTRPRMGPPFPAYGRSDLDPFNGEIGIGRGGGMFLDPQRLIDPTMGGELFGGPENLPRGAVPPGARFDPIGPVGGRRRNPDPDMPSPPGSDNMYL